MLSGSGNFEHVAIKILDYQHTAFVLLDFELCCTEMLCELRVDASEHEIGQTKFNPFDRLLFYVEALSCSFLFFLSNRPDNVPPVQHEVSVFVLLLIIEFFPLDCSVIEQITLLEYMLLPKRLFGNKVSHCCRIILNEAILFVTSSSI